MTDASLRPPGEREAGLRPLALTLSAAFLIETLDSTILVAALPAIAASFGVDPLRVNLALSAYLVTLAALMPASGWCADRFGARRVFLWAMTAFMLTSLGAALAPDLRTLVAMRALQGAAGALMTPIGRLLLVRHAPREQLANAIAWLSMPALIGPVLGPLAGGLIVTWASWPWIFAVKLPFGLLGLWQAARRLPADRPQPVQPFDGRGFAGCAGVLAIAQLLQDQLVHRQLGWPSLALLGAGLPLLAALTLRHLRRTPRPVLALDLLHQRLFGAGFWAGGLSRIGLNAVPFLLQLQLQLGFGWTAAQAGGVVFIVAAGALVFKPLNRHVLALLGFRGTLAGNAAAGAVLALGLAAVRPDTPAPALLALVLAFGIVRSLQFNTTNTLMFADLPRERQSAGSALGGVGQQLSMALGISLAAGLVARLQADGARPPVEAMALAMVAAAAVLGISALAFLRLRPDDGRDVSHHRARPPQGSA
jgi:MFS family permease